MSNYIKQNRVGSRYIDTPERSSHTAGRNWLGWVHYLREEVGPLCQVGHGGGDIRDEEVALAGEKEQLQAAKELLPGSLGPAERLA